MVSDTEERRDFKAYSLERIRELAENGHIHYMSRRVFIHTENLGYSPDDVNKCIASLTDANYRGTVRYDGKAWLDEYLISYTGPSGHVDDLYIKLKLNRGCVVIQLASFHPEGAI